MDELRRCLKSRDRASALSLLARAACTLKICKLLLLKFSMISPDSPGLRNAQAYRPVELAGCMDVAAAIDLNLCFSSFT